MNIKQFVDQNSLEHVKSFLLTLRDLEETNGKQVRDIEYFIRLREEREAEEAQLKAEKEMAERFATATRGKFRLQTEVNGEGEVECLYGGLVYTVKVISERLR
jgi:hypothetical protein